MKIINTKEAAKILGVSISRLSRAAWEGKINPPQRGPGGAFMWTVEDLQWASCVLLHCGLNDEAMKKLKVER